MKKHTVIALVSAIAIAAGTLSAVNLTNASREAQGSVQNSGESAGISWTRSRIFTRAAHLFQIRKFSILPVK